MSTLLLLAGLALSHGVAMPDSSVVLRRGDVVELRDLDGEVTVEGRDGSTLSVVGADGGARALSIIRTDRGVRVGPPARRGRSLDARVKLRVPSWAALDIQGRELQVSVSGVNGAVSVRNVSGDIRTSRTGGDLDLSSVEGLIDVSDAKGLVHAQSRGDDVRLTRVTGDIDAETGDGDVRLDDVRATNVHAETLDGDVYFAGPMTRGGSYSFSLHDGDATLVVPPGTGAHVKVETFDGEFTSDFPVTLRHYTGEGRFEFTIGDGGAAASIEVFDGEIRILSSPPRASVGGRRPSR